MIEKFSGTSDANSALPDAVRERGEFVLGRLGIGADTLRQLRGKRVLDIGAGGGEAVRLLQSAGVDAVALDIRAPDTVPPDTQYVIGDAYTLPCADNAFDVVLAHAVGALSEGELGPLREAMRVVREGGEVRIGPFGSPQDPHETESAARAAYEKLTEYFPQVTLSPPRPSHVEGYNEHYITITKMPTK